MHGDVFRRCQCGFFDCFVLHNPKKFQEISDAKTAPDIRSSIGCGIFSGLAVFKIEQSQRPKYLILADHFCELSGFSKLFHDAKVLNRGPPRAAPHGAGIYAADCSGGRPRARIMGTEFLHP